MKPPEHSCQHRAVDVSRDLEGVAVLDAWLDTAHVVLSDGRASLKNAFGRVIRAICREPGSDVCRGAARDRRLVS